MIQHLNRVAFDHPLTTDMGLIHQQPAQLVFADAGLSECELKVLRCLAQDMSNAKIAESLRVTENTVRYHLKNIYSKLGVATRVGAAVWAVKHLPPFVED